MIRITKMKQDGFTLIELLIVIVIILLLAVTVFVALNPSKRIKDAKDARRTADVETILTAVHEYIVDNKGAYPSGLSAGLAEVQLGTDVSGCAISSGGCLASTSACLDLTTPLANYLKNIPQDPGSGTAGKTAYTISVSSAGIVTVKACNAENTTISISR